MFNANFNREQDWIIDTLALRDDLTVLNEVFADLILLKYSMEHLWI